MRISDWSSDVCSSDLDPATDRAGLTTAKGHRHRFRHCKEGSRPFPPTQRRRCLRSSSENPAAKPDDQRRGSMPVNPTDRKCVMYGKSESLRLDIGVRRRLKQNKPIKNKIIQYSTNTKH